MSGSDVGPVVPVPLWIVQHPDIQPHALRLWMYLYGYHLASRAPDGLTRQTIAEGLGCCLDSVDRWARQLVNADALSVGITSVPGVSGQTNTYDVRLTAPTHRAALVRPGAVQASDESALERLKVEVPPIETALTPLSKSRAGAPSRRYSSTTRVRTHKSTERSTYVPEKLTPFMRFWTRYPRRHNKAKAVLRWKKLRLDDHIDAVMAGLDLWLRLWTAEATEEKFIPHATTWLNARRWEDEFEIPAPRPTLSKQTVTMAGATTRFLDRHKGDPHGTAFAKTYSR
jgi:hypothetical protein